MKRSETPKSRSTTPASKNPNLPVVLLWGGTGGHIFPLVALKKTLSKRGFWPFYWIGESHSLEEKIALAEGVEFLAIKSGKLRRYFSLRTFVEPINIARGFFQSLAILRRLRPAFVFSKWGYVSLPAAIAAKCLDIPVFLQESDSIPGMSNRAVAKFSKTVFLGFPEAVEYFPDKECVVSGQLLDPGIDWGKGRIQSLRPKVLVMGGSLGSSRIFRSVLAIVPTLSEIDFEIVLGKLNSWMRQEFAPFGNVVCHEFLPQSEMAEAYSRADLVITRAGATSLAEIEASGADMVIVPLEWSANGHQWANARAYAGRGYQILPEAELDRLWASVLETLSSKRRTSSISHVDGTEIVTNAIIERLVPWRNS